MDARDLAPGTLVGAYELQKPLGRGALGTSYVADGPSGQVVVRILKASLTNDPLYRRQLQDEIARAREVRHPRWVQILDIGDHDGVLFVVTRLVEGPGSLRTILSKEKRLSIERTVSIASDVASGLIVLHEAGLVHRDVTPSSVLIEHGDRADLGDIGLAKGRAYTRLTTAVNQVFGPVDYMAPEIVRGDPALPASDLYALACVLHECLAGVPPFKRDFIFEVPLAHLSDPPPDVRDSRADVPASIAEAILRALSKDPHDRPALEPFVHALGPSHHVSRRDVPP